MFAKVPVVDFSSVFSANVDIVSKALLQLSTSSDSSAASTGGAGVESADLKAKALLAITTIQTTYKAFVKSANAVVDNLSGFTTTGADKFNKFDKVFEAVKLLEDIGGKAAEMVKKLVSRCVAHDTRTKATHP